MNTESPTIPAETARHVLWMYDRLGGVQPGSCTEYLIRAVQSADVFHAAKLRQVFPELSAAIHLARYDEEGIASLQRIATGDASTEESPAPQCPEALFNPDTGDLRRCIQNGRHDHHQTVDGTQWHIPVATTAEVPF